ncbi:MAG: stage V sporulation protein D [Clostridia bacterium]|nr:stage V sporulation protein D [Clostridia bacterium]
MKKIKEIPRIKQDFSITVLRKRLFAIVIAVAFLFCFVLGRLFYVQVIWGEDLQEKALDQWTREIPVVAARGRITDLNGVVLADNDDTYTVFVRKKAVKDMGKLCETLSDVLSLDYEYVYKRLTETRSGEVTVKKQVKKDKINALLSYNFDGVYYSRDNSRTYPYNETLAQVLGFTSTDGKGQAGLELYYDKYLKGMDGEILYETDIVGVEIDGGKASYIPATDGLNVKLTIDSEIQQLCESAMTEAYEIHSAKSAQMLVIDPSSGAIRAVAIKPSFDLNEVPRDDLDALAKLSRNNLFCDVYEPGSTFKILTSAANIEEHLQGNKSAFSVEHVFSSSRYRYVDGQRVKCWSNHANGKHSNLNLQGALNNSCNPIFVDIAMSLGKETMYKYIDLFGFGSVTGVDFNGESQGMILPMSAVLNVDLARIAFGQTIAVTGLQLAAATAAAVNGGKYYVPYLLEEIYSDFGVIAEKNLPKLRNRVISEKASAILSSMLEKVVEEGSGKQAYIEGAKVAGKTGTAQKYENGRIAAGKYVASFVGYFPADDPKYLALVVIDEPKGEYYGSTVAAPYAKQVFEGIIKLKGM